MQQNSLNFKSQGMNAFTIQQEIILLTSSTFSKRQSCEIKSLNKVNYLSLSQKLEKACWDGLLNNALPEITIRPTCFTTLSVKEVRNCKSCLLQTYKIKNEVLANDRKRN